MAQAVTWLKRLCGAREPPQTPEAPLNPPRETLFRQEGPGGVTYRIPALLHVPPRTLLAFAEKRSSIRDEDAQLLVLRRGRWNGRKVEWGPAEELSQLTLPAHRTMNPCPLYDANSGTVFLFCICVRRRVSEWHQIVVGRSAARLCCSSSPDGGLTWSPLRDLTHEAIASDLPYWATFAVGPGHGVQLDSGRLAVPAYAYYVHGRLCGVPLPCFTRPHSFVFYSDDGGRSWQKGSLLRGMRTGECQVAEIAAEDGGRLLYCSARRPCRCRAVAVSADRGQRFGLPARSPALCEPPQGCQGSVVSFVPTTIGCPVGTTKSPSRDTRRWLLCSDSTNQRLRCRSGNESPSRDTQRCLLCATSPESPSRDTQLCYHPTNQQQRCDLGLHVHTAPPSECPTGTASTESPNGDTQRRLLSSNPTNQLQQCDLGTESPSGDTQHQLLCSNPTNQLQQCDLGTESPSGDTQRQLLCSNPTNQLQQCDLGTESPSGDTQRWLLCSNPTNQLQQCCLGTESPNGDTQHQLLCSNPTNQLQQCDLGTESPNGDTQRWLLCSDSTNQRLRCHSGNESPSRDTQCCLLCATSLESPSRDTQLCYHSTNQQQRCDLGLHVHTAPPSECPTGTASTETPNGDTQRRLLCSNPTNQLQQCDLGTESPSGDTQRQLLCSNPTNQLQQCDLGTESPSGDTQHQLLCSNPTNQLQQCDLGTESPNGDTQRRLLCSNPTNQLQQCDLGTESPSGDTQRWLLYSHPTNRRHRRDLGLYVNTAPPNEGGWRHPRVLQEGPCGYSDLAVCPDGVFGCLFECGEVSGCEEIAFCLFTLGTAGGGEGSERPCLGKEPIFGVLSPKSSGENSEEDVRDANPAEEKQRCKAFN